MKTKQVHFIKLSTVVVVFLMFVATLIFAAIHSTSIAYALPLEEFEPGVYFDYEKYAKDNNYTYISQHNPEWEDAGQTERMVYVLFRSNKDPHRKELASIKAYHKYGNTTTLAVGASLLEQKETIRAFGIDVESKIGAVIGKIGGGWKWGEASSYTITREGTATISKTQPDVFVTRYATANVYEYYLYVYKITRTIVKEKDKIIGYTNYCRSFDDSLSGKFESFDLGALSDSIIYTNRVV